MFENNEYSWLIFLALTVVIYTIPTFYRIWKLRKRKASMTRHPAGKKIANNQANVSALLGVVYPSSSRSSKDDSGR